MASSSSQRYREGSEKMRKKEDVMSTPPTTHLTGTGGGVRGGDTAHCLDLSGNRHRFGFSGSGGFSARRWTDVRASPPSESSVEESRKPTKRSRASGMEVRRAGGDSNAGGGVGFPTGGAGGDSGSDLSTAPSEPCNAPTDDASASKWHTAVDAGAVGARATVTLGVGDAGAHATVAGTQSASAAAASLPRFTVRCRALAV